MKFIKHTLLTLLILFTGPTLSHAGDASTLYDKLGAHEGLTEIISDLFDYIEQDARIAHTFENSNKDRIETLLVQQICELSGGGCVYEGMDMKRAHTGLGLTHAHFNAMVEDLQKAMSDNDIPFNTQNKLLALLAPMQRDTIEHRRAD